MKAQLKESIKETRFWDNIMVRPKGNKFIAMDSSQSYTTVFREHVLKKYRNAMRRFQFKHAPHEQ